MTKEATTELLTITPYQRRYRQAVQDLLFHSARVHTHLDWYHSDYWLDDHAVPVHLGWQDDQLAGLLATASPMGEICWLRIVALQDQQSTEAILQPLWQALANELRGLGVKTVFVLAINSWLETFITDLDFHPAELVITMHRISNTYPEAYWTPDTNDIRIYSTTRADLEDITAVDNAAFPPPWQLNLEDLRQAYRVSDNCTIAVLNDEVIGYQLSTLHNRTGHLARLAVTPTLQRHGVGRLLLEDLIRRFGERNIHTLTVNTQASNRHSQHLYARYGFQHNGHDLAVWSVNL
jgi:[ribosomal protein S18]-alanine N-acetyltransferase